MKICKTLTRPETFTLEKVDLFHTSDFIQSNVPPDNNPRLGFRSWRYETFAVSIKKPDNLHEICANTGCGIFLVDKTFLVKNVPSYPASIQKTNIMKMRGLKNALFIITEHFPINFRVPGRTIDGTPAIINITR